MIKVRRQHSIWRYVLDFYCKDLKLCIEIDWDNHFEEEAKEYDNIRSEYLESVWIEVIRFTNNDITKNIDWVLENLKIKISEKAL